MLSASQAYAVPCADGASTTTTFVPLMVLYEGLALTPARPPANPGRKPSSKPGAFAGAGEVAICMTKPAGVEDPCLATRRPSKSWICGVPLTVCLKLCSAADGSSV